MYYLTSNEWLHQIFWKWREKHVLLIKNDEVWQKYEEIWDVIKNKLGIKFHSEPIYEKKYLKTKIREFGSDIKANFLGNDLLKENMYYTCIVCITIDSVIKMNKKIIHKFI